MNDFKKSLREEYKLRSDVENRKEKEKAITDLLINSDLFSNADTVFLYASDKKEVSTENIALEAERIGKKTAYPFCENKNGEMCFYLSNRNELKKGMYGISEPDTQNAKKAYFTEKSLCIVPGVAFSKRGERLGRGKGYYDRFLSEFKGKTVALSFEETLCENTPTEEHDVKINYLVTEKMIYKTE